MFKTDIARTAAAILCTIVFSATCVIGAVGPATSAASFATPSATPSATQAIVA